MRTVLRANETNYHIFLLQTYPEHLHNEKRHMENPLCPYIEIVDYDLLSPVPKNISKQSKESKILQGQEA